MVENGKGMTKEKVLNLENFQFHGLHPKISIGTASDRYVGWIGQIYSKERYKGRISTRSHNVGGQAFKEQVLPVESVKEYFEHFSVLEFDFTFYGLLRDKDLKPTRAYRVVDSYRKYLSAGGRVIIKVPQVISAQRLWRGGKYSENFEFLNKEIFTDQFYKPVNDLLGDLITAFIFEQEYQLKNQRRPPTEYAEMLDRFFSEIPEDNRYHMETRTEPYLIKPYFNVLKTHGIGQVLSNWTWLPPVKKQFEKSGRTFLSAGKHSVIRLMTPLNVRYEEAYAKAFPFNKLVEGLFKKSMVDGTVQMISEAIDQGVHVNVVVNNRAGGNAPLIAQKISQEFLVKYNDRVYKKEKAG